MFLGSNPPYLFVWCHSFYSFFYWRLPLAMLKDNPISTEGFTKWCWWYCCCNPSWCWRCFEWKEKGLCFQKHWQYSKIFIGGQFCYSVRITIVLCCCNLFYLRFVTLICVENLKRLCLENIPVRLRTDLLINLNKYIWYDMI